VLKASAGRPVRAANSQTSETSPAPASTRCTRAAKIPDGTATRCEPAAHDRSRVAVAWLWKWTPTVAVSWASRRRCVEPLGMATGVVAPAPALSSMDSSMVR
jgi:hypothetical protein